MKASNWESQWFQRTNTGQVAGKDLPPMVIEEVKSLAATHAVDLNTCQKVGDAYLIGYPPTGLTILADRNGAIFQPRGIRVPAESSPEEATPAQPKRRISP